MKKFFERIAEMMKNRVFIMFGCIILLFILLGGRLYYLQILHGEEYQQALKTSIMKTLTIPASRGNIYDRYGRPLATNQVAFSVKIDDSIKVDLEDRNEQLYTLVTEMEQMGQIGEDPMPITRSAPYSFTFGAGEDAEEKERAWKSSMGIPKAHLEDNAAEILEYLSNKYEIPENTPLQTRRNIIYLGSTLSDRNLMLTILVRTLMSNGETLVDDLPLSNTAPVTFLFDGNKSKEDRWKQDAGIKEKDLGMNAQECYEYLWDFYGIPANLSPDLTRNLTAINYALYLKRFYRYQPVTIALNINNKTVAAIEEKQDTFAGVTIDTDSLRNYPAGKYFSHILGYIRKISDEEYEDLKNLKDADGNQIYSTSDIVGKSGIEYAMEQQLNGSDGEMYVEVDNVGRRINTIETKQPISGTDVFLTIDQKLQAAAYDYLEQELTSVLIYKMTRASAQKDDPISLKEFFSSLVACNTIKMRDIFAATEGEQLAIKELILRENPGLTISAQEDKAIARETLINAIDNNSVSFKQLLLVLIEQGKITADEDYLTKIRVGAVTPLSVVVEKLQSGELRPCDTNLDPCSGSVVVSDINSGEALAMVTYPSYDNNEFVNHFNNQYYNDLMENPNTPMVNRPLSEKKAPGSTFKMVTAVAGLETGIVTPQTTIRDEGTFTKSGRPYARCWIGGGAGSHGLVNVSSALEVSCNYFFYETAYRMNNGVANGDEAIITLNDYMAAFGLNSVTGVEIGERAPTMASPQYKEEIIKMQNPDATTSQTRWVDADTIRTAIGQSVNSYAPAHINKYVATLANGGTRYKMHLVDHTLAADGTINQVEPTIENILDISQSTLNAVFQGMLQVTQGARGTLRTIFKDFPIDVAAKSGTAQEDLDRSSHTWFVGFAPYDKPQISVTVMIPFGEASGSPAAVVAKNIIAEYMGLNYQGENTNMENILSK